MQEFNIGNFGIGGNNGCFIIAELSANHNQDYNLAVETIHAMKESGADAVKVQTYTADTITIDCNMDHFLIKSPSKEWNGRSFYDLYKSAFTPWDWQPKLMEVASSLGMAFFSSPFDNSAVDFLEDMDAPAYKIASPEITDIPLIEYVASKGKPMIISTGIATAEDIELAIAACKNQGNDKLVVLKCTTAYPAPFSEVNLNTIPGIQQRFNVIPGLSDHTGGHSVATAAVALGAKVVEKHYILNRKGGGEDAFFSMEPAEFKAMVKSVRQVEQALGKTTFELSDSMKKSRAHSRSLFVVQDVRKGEAFTVENIRSIRPGYGMHPKYLKDVLGKLAATDLERGTPLEKKHLTE